MKVLIVKTDAMLKPHDVDCIREEIIRQIHNGAVVVLDGSLDCEVVDIDAVETSPLIE